MILADAARAVLTTTYRKAGFAMLSSALTPDNPARRGWGTLHQAAQYLNTSDQTVRRRIADGTLKAYRFGREIRIKWDDLDRLLSPIPTVER